MLGSGFKESSLIRNPLTGLCNKRKRLIDGDAEGHSRPPIPIQGWERITWETYIYYLHSGSYMDKPCDLLELFKLADMVGDQGLMKRLTVWFERSSNADNITKRVFSDRYQSHCLAPLQQRFRKIFLSLWMENGAVRKTMLEFLDHLEVEEKGSHEWTAAKARKLYGELMAKLPFQKCKTTVV